MLESISHAQDPSNAECHAHVCERCGYGISLARPLLPSCPMCRASAWVPERDLTGRLRSEAA